MSEKNKFCVITTQRTGSTWLIDLIDSHPQIKAFEEAFIEVNRKSLVPDKNKRLWTDKVFIPYDEYRKSSSTVRPWLLFKYLDILETYQSEPHDTIGFKIMYNQIQRYPEFLLKIILDKYRVIHLVRRNHIDVLISKAVARQYKVFHTINANSGSKQVSLDTSSLIRKLDLYEKMYHLAQIGLNLMPIPVLEVSYESLVANQNIILSSIADFLQVDSTCKNFESELKKVNSGSYQEKIANYDEVYKTLENSKYVHLLVD